MAYCTKAKEKLLEFFTRWHISIGLLFQVISHPPLTSMCSHCEHLCEFLNASVFGWWRPRGARSLKQRWLRNSLRWGQPGQRADGNRAECQTEEKTQEPTVSWHPENFALFPKQRCFSSPLSGDFKNGMTNLDCISCLNCCCAGITVRRVTVGTSLWSKRGF